MDSVSYMLIAFYLNHDDVIKWNLFSRNWPFVRGIHRFPMNSPHKGQWCGALMFSLICVWINDWVNTREAGDLKRYRAHHDVIVMVSCRVRYLHGVCMIPLGVGHDDVIQWRHFPRHWPFVRGIHRSSMDSPHKASDAELWCFLWSAPEQTVG